MAKRKSTFESRRNLNQVPVSKMRGQIVVEYVLLLLVVVSLALLIINTMVNRNPDSPGFLIRAWSGWLETIGRDKADDVAPPAN